MTNDLMVALTAQQRTRIAVLCDKVAAAMSFPLAARAAGIPYSTAVRWRRNHPEFQVLLCAAEERRLSLLEAEAWRRALAGSDTMLVFMLKAANPATYNEKLTLALTGPNGAPLELGDDQRAQRINTLFNAIRHRAQRDAVDADYREVEDGSDLV